MARKFIVGWELHKALRPSKYTTDAGIEVTHDYWNVDVVGTREALEAHPLFSRVLLPPNKMRCHKLGVRNSRKRDGRVRILVGSEVAAQLDERFQTFMAPFRAMSDLADECR